jgi:isocitrate dehydrogenase
LQLKLIDPGFDAMTPEKQAQLCQEVEQVLTSIWDSHGNGQWQQI